MEHDETCFDGAAAGIELMQLGESVFCSRRADLGFAPRCRRDQCEWRREA
jgi:hypothetical protein